VLTVSSTRAYFTDAVSEKTATLRPKGNMLPVASHEGVTRARFVPPSSCGFPRTAFRAYSRHVTGTGRFLL